jgi:2-methylcitrate dehydratase PrpD
VALARSVEIGIDSDIDRAYPEIYGGRVTLLATDGRMLSKHVKYSRGMPENPMSFADIERKFMSLGSAAVGSEAAAEILALAKDVFSADSVAPLNGLLTRCSVVELAQP